MWSAGESSWTDGSQQDQQEVGDPGLLNAQPIERTDRVNATLHFSRFTSGVFKRADEFD